ncbi:MAG: Rab family GTPase [Candidatus Hermodarchaeota archaeon]
MSENEYLLKICVIGRTKLKTKLVRRFAGAKFDTNYLPTQGVDIITKKINIDNNQIKLILFDTAGQEFFGKLRPSYYRGASAATIVFDKSDLKTFKSVPDWLAEFRNQIPDISIPITLVGIRNEAEEKLTTEEAQVLAEKLRIQYVETSLDDLEKIKEIFYALTKTVLYLKSSEANY